MRRAPLLGTLAVIAAVLGAVSPGVAGSRAPEASHDPAPASFYGLVIQQGSVEYAEALRMERAAVGTVRFVIPWGRVERSDDEFDFDGVDAQLEAIRRIGAEPVPFVYGTPDWIGDPRTPPIYGQRDRDGWQEFMRRLVRRYGPGGTLDREGPGFAPVRRWQIWNEPNLAAFWGHATPSASEYADLFHLSATAIADVDPRAELITAGLPPTRKGIPAPQFLTELYDAYAALGLPPEWDELGVHPYGAGPNGSLENVQAFHDAAVAAATGAGTATPPILVGEIGWGSRGRAKQYLAGTPRSQARKLRRAYELLAAQREALDISSVLWFAWRDLPQGTGCIFCDNVGLLDEAGRPKPAWTAFRTMPR